MDFLGFFLLILVSSCQGFLLCYASSFIYGFGHKADGSDLDRMSVHLVDAVTLLSALDDL